VAPRLLVVQNDSSDPVGPLGEWLGDAGLELEVSNAATGDPLPGDLSGYDGLLVLGGAMGAEDDARAPWLPQLRALMSAAVADELPTLGICLGAQLLAVATGGRVAPNPDGPEFGAQLIAKRAASATDPLFGPMPITPDVLQWHYDAVTVLPPGAVQLASSPGCDVQAFRVGRLAWGVQGHIETTPALVRAWAADDAGALEDYDVERILERSDAVHDDITEVWRPFAQAFAHIVAEPSSVPKTRTIATSTAEPITDPAEIRAALAAQMQAAHQHPGVSTLPWPSTER